MKEKETKHLSDDELARLNDENWIHKYLKNINKQFKYVSRKRKRQQKPVMDIVEQRANEVQSRVMKVSNLMTILNENSSLRDDNGNVIVKSIQDIMTERKVRAREREIQNRKEKLF